jgi:hypothetical protein
MLAFPLDLVGVDVPAPPIFQVTFDYAPTKPHLPNRTYIEAVNVDEAYVKLEAFKDTLFFAGRERDISHVIDRQFWHSYACVYRYKGDSFRIAYLARDNREAYNMYDALVATATLTPVPILRDELDL